MNRRSFLKAGAVAAAALPFSAAGRLRAQARATPALVDGTRARARDIVDSTIVVDMLHQLNYRIDLAETRRRWLYEPGAFTEAEFQAYRASGISVIGMGNAGGDFDTLMRHMAAYNGLAAAYPDRLLRIDDSADFARVKRDGKLGLLITTQNSRHFRTVEDVDLFFGLGQRSSQLTYNQTNEIGSGAFEDPARGLTDFGARIIERMNAVGMAVDLGHGGDQTILDALRVTRRPAIISHANCRALHPGYPRAVTDEAIRALAKTGGVIGITFISFMVKAQEPTSVDDVVDHVDHVTKLVGIDHVGIGSDYGLESNDRMPDRDRAQQMLRQADPRYRVHARESVEALSGGDRFYVLAEAMLRRGYTPEHIRLVLGGNWQRVLGQIWNR
jgi:membrane dipeptidase